MLFFYIKINEQNEKYHKTISIHLVCFAMHAIRKSVGCFKQQPTSDQIHQMQPPHHLATGAYPKIIIYASCLLKYS